MKAGLSVPAFVPVMVALAVRAAYPSAEPKVGQQADKKQGNALVLVGAVKPKTAIFKAGLTNFKRPNIGRFVVVMMWKIR